MLVKEVTFKYIFSVKQLQGKRKNRHTVTCEDGVSKVNTFFYWKSFLKTFYLKIGNTDILYSV